ncbi:MAG: hypothetical protein M1833_006186 [Piccolia ochrophora]|nr:MAG: hypothetical protein M1833_006186 [Piccolia ochrophora]
MAFRLCALAVCLCFTLSLMVHSAPLPGSAFRLGSGLNGRFKSSAPINPSLVPKITWRMREEGQRMINAQELRKKVVLWPEHKSLVKFALQSESEKPVISGELLQDFADTLDNENAASGQEVLSVGDINYKNQRTLLDFSLFGVDREYADSTFETELLPRDVQNIYAAKEIIMENTGEGDLIIFFENSGYFYHAFAPEDRRNVHIVPFSGNPGPQELEDEGHMVQELIQNTLTPVFAQDFDRVFIVDYYTQAERLLPFLTVLKSSGLMQGKDPTVLPIFAPPNRIWPRPDGIYKAGAALWGGAVYGAGIQIATRWEEINRLFYARVGKIQAPHPLEYWDLLPQTAAFPDQRRAAWMIQQIRTWTPSVTRFPVFDEYFVPPPDLEASLPPPA